MTKQDGGPAFPVVGPTCTTCGGTGKINYCGAMNWCNFCAGKGHLGHYGMTMRDKFAERAMGSLLLEPGANAIGNAERIALNAYTMADAMLRAREKDG